MEKINTDISQDDLVERKEYRERIDLLKSRLELLIGKDKVLMKMYLENGNSFRQMARIAGVNEASIARRIHKITSRLIDGIYITCLRNRDEFTQGEINIAKDYFLAGLPMTRIAGRRRCSLYRVREALKKIQKFVTVNEKEAEGQRDDG